MGQGQSLPPISPACPPFRAGKGIGRQSHAEAFIPYIETFERVRAEANRVPRAIDALAEKNPDRLHYEPGVLLVTPCKDNDPPGLLECEIEFGGVTLPVYQWQVKIGDGWQRAWVFPREPKDLERYKRRLADEGRLRAADVNAAEDSHAG